jgi:hypothetical protein
MLAIGVADMFLEDDRLALLTREKATFAELMVSAANALRDNGL